jgi:ribose 5-phosphate isomerase A
MEEIIMGNLEKEKALAAARAVDEVQDGMLIGLGTGTTAGYVVREVARRIEMGLKVTATATSRGTESLAVSLGIPFRPFEELSRVDLTIDGADEIDPLLRAIKGANGALLREKVVAEASDREIIVVDSSKPVATLGRAKLPVEVLPFAACSVERELRTFGAPLARRTNADGSDFRTDQGDFIYDISFGNIADPESLARALENMPGLIGHGLFLSQIDLVD